MSRTSSTLMVGVDIHQMCACGHSEAAHRTGGSVCTFCDCPASRFDHVEQEAARSRPAGRPDLQPYERYVPLQDVAEALRVTPTAIRRAARHEGIPIINEGARQVVEALHIPVLERRASRRSRAQRAERRAFEDGQARMRGRGRSMTEPALLGVMHGDAARRAEVEAMEHILDAGASEHRVLPARVPRGRREAARLAERRALDDILKPRPASPPERSL